MNREQVIAALRAHETELRRRGVSHVALFGSVARGEATENSDIDLLIELDPRAPVGLFEYVTSRNTWPTCSRCASMSPIARN